MVSCSRKSIYAFSQLDFGSLEEMPYKSNEIKIFTNPGNLGPHKV